MSDRQILISQAGPLPLEASLMTGSAGPATLFVSGSVWTEEASGDIGVAVMMDGNKVGEATIWSNSPSEHRAVVPVFVNVSFDKEWPSETQPPTYEFELVPLNAQTVSDVNDRFQLSVVA